MSKDLLFKSRNFLLYIGIAAFFIAIFHSFNFFEWESNNGYQSITLLTIYPAMAKGSYAMLTCGSVLILTVMLDAIIWLNEANRQNNESNENLNEPFSFKGMLSRLEYSKNDPMLMGVCGGLGECSPIPVWIWRAIFVALLFYSGLGFFAYCFTALFFKDVALFYILSPKSKTSM